MHRYLPESVLLEAADTDPHTFPAGPATYVYFTTPAGNAGTVTIGSVGGTGGIILGAGVGVTLPVVIIGPIQKLDHLTYEFSNANDELSYLVLR